MPASMVKATWQACVREASGRRHPAACLPKGACCSCARHAVQALPPCGVCHKVATAGAAGAAAASAAAHGGVFAEHSQAFSIAHSTTAWQAHGCLAQLDLNLHWHSGGKNGLKHI